MHIKRLSALFIGISLLLTGCSVSVTEPAQTTAESTVPITSIRAQDDYYGHINLESLQNTTLEYGETQAGSFENIDIEQQLIDSTLKIVNNDEDFPEGSCEQIISDAYSQFLAFQSDEAAQTDACRTVIAELAKITDAKTLDELLTVAEELSVEYGCDAFSGLSVGMDYSNPDEYSISRGQTLQICGVPLEKIDEEAYFAKEYEKRIIDTLQVAGKSYEEAELITHDLMLLIIDIAWSTDFTITNASNPYSYFTFMTQEEIDASLSSLSSRDYEQAAGLENNPYGGWLVMDRVQLAAIDAVFKEENLDELKTWAAYEFLSQYGMYITSEYDIYEQYFPKSHETEDVQAIKFIDSVFSSALSDLYVKAYYTEEMDRQFSEMCEDIRESYRDLITDSDWLSTEARQKILQKLDNIRFVDGGFCLEQMKDNPKINEVFGDNIFETRRNAAKASRQEFINLLGQPRDRMEIGLPMHMVNACYNFDNTVTITVAIMSAPFFDENADCFTNLGGLGMVVAHEVGHAFDSDMIRYNETGVYDPSWLPEADMTALEQRNQVAVEYFEKYFSVFDVYHVDGELTLGENYADLGAMECITNIAKNADDYRKIFENYARIWSELTLNTYIIEQLAEDSHSPATIRVNAILATTDAFYDVYEITDGDGMYVAPENRISRWK